MQKIESEKSIGDIIEIIREDWHKKNHREEIASQLKMYVPSVLGSRQQSCDEDKTIAEVVMHRFLDNEDRLLLLLGEHGSGKSFFSHWLAHNTWQSKSEWIPILINLPNVKISKGFFERYLHKKYRLSVDDIVLLRKSSRILLILDSYDQMKEKFRGGNLYQLGELQRWDIKVVITCGLDFIRQFAPAEQQQAQVFDPYQESPVIMVAGWDKYYLQPWDHKTQLPAYISIWKERYPDIVIPELDYYETISLIPGLAELSTNPLMLRMIMYALPKIIEYYSQKDTPKNYSLTRLELYGAFTETWFEDQRDSLSQSGLIDDSWARTILYDYREYCQQLATLMWSIKVNSVRYNQKVMSSTANDNNIRKSPRLKKEFWNPFFELEGGFKGDINRPLPLIRLGALLKVSDDSRYAFQENGLLEYFASTKIFDNVVNCIGLPLGLEINSHSLKHNPAMIRFGVDYIARHAGFVQVLLRFVQDYKHDSRIKVAAENAAAILSAKDNKDLLFNQISGMQKPAFFCEELDANVLSCAFSPNGHYYVALTENSVTVYEAKTHLRLSRHFPYLLQGDKLSAFSFLACSDSLLLSTEKGFLVAFSILKGKILRQWAAHAEAVSAVAISRDGCWVLSSSCTGELKLWDLKSENLIANWQGHDLTINALVFSLDGTWAISASDDMTIKRWDTATGQCLATWMGHKGAVKALAMSASGHWVVSGSADNKLKLWHVHKNVCELTMNEHRSPVTSLAISHDGYTVFSGSEDKTVKQWICRTGKSKTTWKGHGGSISTLAVSPDGRWLLTGSHDKTIKRWECGNSELVRHCANVDSLVFNSDERWAVSSSVDQTIKCWDITRGYSTATWHGHFFPSSPVVLSQDDLWAFSGYRDGSIRRWQCSGGQFDARWLAHAGAVNTLVVSPDNRWVLSGSDDKTIKRWNSLTFECLGIWKGHTGVINGLKLSMDGRWAFSGSRDTTIRRWDVARGECISTWYGHTASVSALVLSSDNQWVLTGAEDKTIKKWQAATGQCLSTWETLENHVNALALNYDGQLAISSDGLNMIIWQVTTGQQLKKIEFNTVVSTITWSSKHPHQFLLGTIDGVVSLWNFNVEKLKIKLEWQSKESLPLVSSRLVEESTTIGNSTQSKSKNSGQPGVLRSRLESSASAIKLTAIESQCLAWQQFDDLNPVQSLFNPALILKPDNWVVSVVRHKRNDAKTEFFLILESVEDDCYRIRRVDHVISRRHEFIIPKNGTSGRSGNLIGQRYIEIIDKSVEETKMIVSKSCARSVEINSSQGCELLANIRKDQNECILRASSEVGSRYRMFNVSIAPEKHDNEQWCEQHLKRVGVKALGSYPLIKGLIYELISSDTSSSADASSLDPDEFMGESIVDCVDGEEDEDVSYIRRVCAIM